MYLRFDPKALEHTPIAQIDPMIAIETAIWNSEDFSNEKVRKLLVWMLRQSDCLTKPIAISLFEENHEEGFPRTSAMAVHDMESVNGKTRMDEILDQFNTEMGFCSHGGCFTKTGKGAISFDSLAKGYTIWISYVFYDYDANILQCPGDDVLSNINPPY